MILTQNSIQLQMGYIGKEIIKYGLSQSGRGSDIFFDQNKLSIYNLISINLIMQREQKTLVQLLSERKFAILILLFEVGIILAHGYGAYYPIYATTTPQTDYSDQMILYTLTAFLALLGYGLVIASADGSAVTGLATTLIVVAISVQLTPLLLQFWYNVFNGFPQTVQVSLKTERITMALCTSLLASLTSLVGRLGKIQTFIIIFVYNIGWTLSLQATQYIQAQKSPSTPQLYDDYGTNYIYVFAGCFAFFTSIILNLKLGKPLPAGSRHSALISLIGTGFIFACFPFTGIFYSSAASSNIYRRFQGPLNIYFALSASVIMTYVSSAIFGKLKIGVRQSLVGVLSGGVMIGVIAGTINNIGGCIAIGAVAGFISGFYLQVLHPRINMNRAVDSLGIFGPILICAIIGGLVVSPAMYQTYKTNGLTTLAMGDKITDANLALYQLVYFGIAALVASGSGLLAALLAYKFRDSETDFAFDKLVSTDYGIFRAPDPSEEPEPQPELQPEQQPEPQAQAQVQAGPEEPKQIQPQVGPLSQEDNHRPAQLAPPGSQTNNELRNDGTL